MSAPNDIGVIRAAFFQSISLENAWYFLRWQTHSGVMTASMGAWRTVLATTFGAILLGVLCLSSEVMHPVASMAALATTIAVVAAALIGWERIVAKAESAGLVSPRDSEPR